MTARRWAALALFTMFSWAVGLLRLPHTIRGRVVVEATGDPVKGAFVTAQLHWPDTGSCMSNTRDVGWTQTDANGAYALRVWRTFPNWPLPELTTIHVIAPGYFTSRLTDEREARVVFPWYGDPFARVALRPRLTLPADALEPTDCWRLHDRAGREACERDMAVMAVRPCDGTLPGIFAHVPGARLHRVRWEDDGHVIARDGPNGRAFAWDGSGKPLDEDAAERLADAIPSDERECVVQVGERSWSLTAMADLPMPEFLGRAGLAGIRACAGIGGFMVVAAGDGGIHRIAPNFHVASTPLPTLGPPVSLGEDSTFHSRTTAVLGDRLVTGLAAKIVDIGTGSVLVVANDQNVYRFTLSGEPVPPVAD